MIKCELILELINKINLIIFTKPFDCLEAKTRLRKSDRLENAQVTAIHNNLLSHTLDICLEVQQRNKELSIQVHWFEQNTSNKINKYIDNFDFLLQSGQDFIDKFNNSLSDSLNQNFHTIVIGSDCPMLTSEILQETIDAVKNGNSVIGPCKEKGFYLLALNLNAKNIKIKNIFKDYDNEVSAIKKILGKDKYVLLDELVDIDQYEDIDYVRKNYASEKILKILSY